MQILIRILYLLFLLYFPSTSFSFYTHAIEKGGDCVVTDSTKFKIDILGCDTDPLNIDKTNDLQFIANVPSSEGLVGKDKNLWDLQVFEDRIFIAYGNTTTNPGPIQLFAWDNSLDSLIDYGSIRGEAIEIFRVMNDTLFIPHSDPKGDSRKYNYVKNGQLVDIKLDYKLAHVRDMIYFEDKYYLFGNTRCPKQFRSECSGLLELDGSTYRTDFLISELAEVDPYVNAKWNWFFGGWTYQNKLIIPNATFNEVYVPSYTIKDAQFYTISNGNIQWSATQNEAEKLTHFHFYPAKMMTTTYADSIKFNTILRPHTSVEINDKLVYTLRSYSITADFGNLYQTQYNNSRGMYLKDSLMGVAKVVNFPEPDAVGEDILTLNDQIVVLANKKMEDGTHQVFVYSSTSPSNAAENWKELFHFQSTNLARSFEYHNDTFYFGLGMNEGDEEAGVGELYKLNWSFLIED